MLTSCASVCAIVVHDNVEHVQSNLRRRMKWIHLGVVRSEFGIVTIYIKMLNKFSHEKSVLLLSQIFSFLFV